jgi:hypothetical protein
MRPYTFRPALRVFSAVAGLMVLATVSAVGQQPQPTPTLPDARDIVKKHVAAIGGEAAFKAIKSYHARGKFEMPQQGVTGDLELMAARPNKLLLKVDVAGVGHVESGYDGKNGWVLDPMSGPTLLSGRMLTEAAEDAWFDGTLHAADHIKEITTLAKTEWDKRPAYQVKVVYNSGIDETEYFDAETGFAIGSEAQRETQMGVLPTSTTLREYQKFGTIMEPTVVMQRTMGIDQVLHLSSYVYNDVPPTAFDPPPAIKALIKRP